MAVAEAVERLLHSVTTELSVVCQRQVPANPAQYGAADPRLAAPVREALASVGISELYSHQAQAIGAALSGENVVVITPTASGKTLCYAVPILQSLCERPNSRALLLYPTKALAHDQMDELQTLVQAAGVRAPALAYDGDTPAAQRPAVRRDARLLVTNPDMLHLSILSHHLQWHEFFANLDYLVIDEMHSYRGVFGSHVANVLRRLLRIARFYGSEPRIICASATIANPLELATALTERRFTLVEENGAPTGPRQVLLYNPPVLDSSLGIRRSALADARLVAGHLLAAGLQTAVFCRSRGAVEQLLLELRQDAARMGRDPASIQGYRGGYLPAERRAIEQGLREGTVRCVVSTSALELGVDIGGLAACILVGYPGSIASTWQRIGRAGRGSEESLAVLIADASPLDQYIMARPDYIFDRSAEQALVNPDNLHLLLSHVRCACYELPFRLDESYGHEDVQAILAFLESQGEVRRSRTRWHHLATDYPAAAVSLRSADPDRFIIMARKGRGETVIGMMDRSTAPVYLHEQAIYMHQGQQYLVEQLDWEDAVAHVTPVSVDYVTRASGSNTMQVLETRQELVGDGHTLSSGRVALTQRITGYRRLRLGTLETIGWGPVDLPEQVLDTTAMWLTLDEALVEALSQNGQWVGAARFTRGPNWEEQRLRAIVRDGQRCRWCGAEALPGRPLQVHHIEPYASFGDGAGCHDWQRANALDNLITLCGNCHRLAEQSVAVRGSLAGLGYVVRHLLPTLLLCDAEDVGVLTDPWASQTGGPTLFIYDDLPGGVGLSEQAMHQFDALLLRAEAVVASCGCANGCPSCIGPVLDEDAEAKLRVLELTRSLLIRRGVSVPNAEAGR